MTGPVEHHVSMVMGAFTPCVQRHCETIGVLLMTYGMPLGDRRTHTGLFHGDDVRLHLHAHAHAHTCTCIHVYTYMCGGWNSIHDIVRVHVFVA